jgi:adenylate cyclase class 2
MYIEIEAKLKIESPEAVKQRLAGLGAQFVAERKQTDYHFDDSVGSLARADRCLRLRRQVEGGRESYFLTYKGAKEKSSFKKRQEVEIEVSDGDGAEKLLSALGYEKVLVIEKRRQVWQYGECEVALDHLPLLGDFVEIEGPDEERIAAVQEALGLSSLPHIPKSYAALVKDKQRELGER